MYKIKKETITDIRFHDKRHAYIYCVVCSFHANMLHDCDMTDVTELCYTCAFGIYNEELKTVWLGRPVATEDQIFEICQVSYKEFLNDPMSMGWRRN